MPTSCKSRIRIDKDAKQIWLECDGADDHAACKVNLTAGARAWHRLKNAGKLSKVANLVDRGIESLIRANWEFEHRTTEKSEIRRSFPGMGGDMLNDCLLRLMQGKHVAQGSCGCCYAPVEGAEYLMRKFQRP